MSKHIKTFGNAVLLSKNIPPGMKFLCHFISVTGGCWIGQPKLIPEYFNGMNRPYKIKLERYPNDLVSWLFIQLALSSKAFQQNVSIFGQVRFRGTTGTLSRLM